MGVLLGDIVMDNVTGYCGVVIELTDNGAWVKIDSRYPVPESDSVWLLDNARLIRL